MNHQPSTINPGGVHQSPGSGNPPPALVHHQPSTINYEISFTRY
ncbi:MAG: hypothetical protein ACHBN1_38240 [Heteroscytonema crispum UTEX LB 1556]